MRNRVAGFALGATFGAVVVFSWQLAAADEVPAGSVTVTSQCPYEDGDPSGEPCLWTSPSAGIVYVVDSSEYLD